MDNKGRLAFNIYTVIDNELSRLHDYCNRMVQYEDKASYQDPLSSLTGSFKRFSPADAQISTQISRASKRIFEIQEVLLKALAGHDALVQEKVAELALTGSSSTDESNSDPK